MHRTSAERTTQLGFARWPSSYVNDELRCDWTICISSQGTADVSSRSAVVVGFPYGIDPRAQAPLAGRGSRDVVH